MKPPKKPVRPAVPAAAPARRGSPVPAAPPGMKLPEGSPAEEARDRMGYKAGGKVKPKGR